ncbi:hypothetical protein TNIN_137051 [Trichonephila inaurata madagascariensis]|uniref:Uncharacterized protein n=1 Tax=Trichonephila inaurata madagascariensis TaxID=2747483 RepID=A0A8X6Y4H1_9ARAC|nr:hypothetical protein TNIN_137051 [Trichonephila inaurata madagascariensis]
MTATTRGLDSSKQIEEGSAEWSQVNSPQSVGEKTLPKAISGPIGVLYSSEGASQLQGVIRGADRYSPGERWRRHKNFISRSFRNLIRERS